MTGINETETWLFSYRTLRQFHPGLAQAPATGKITATRIEARQRFSLRFPNGTVADRVEIYSHERKTMLVGRGIEDVRGARIDDRGNSIVHVYDRARVTKTTGWLANVSSSCTTCSSTWMKRQAVYRPAFEECTVP
jgi:hypothetical protein